MGLQLSDCIYDGTGTFNIDDYPTSAGASKKEDRDRIDEQVRENIERKAILQDKLYADGREGLIILFQAMDAAGKDSTIKRVMSGVNPQGVTVTNFKQPSSSELAHDYLWRAHMAVPARGHIALFNRSYYEDVLVARVHQLNRSYKMAERCTAMSDDEFFARRFRQIRNFEEELWENGYRIIKFFLNVSREEQKRRFLERIDDPAKNWKFSDSDLKERALWDQYRIAYQDAIANTATPDMPWYVIPMDQKWYGRWMVSQAIVSTLEDMNPSYPEMSLAQRAELVRCRKVLMKEG